MSCINIKTESGTDCPEYSFELIPSVGKITKVEKIQFITASTNTSVSGGETSYHNGWIESTPVNVSTSTVISSKINTRLYYGDGCYVSMKNCDFIAQEGDTLKVLWFKFGEEFRPVKVVNISNNYTVEYLSFTTKKHVDKKGRVKYQPISGDEMKSSIQHIMNVRIKAPNTAGFNLVAFVIFSLLTVGVYKLFKYILLFYSGLILIALILLEGVILLFLGISTLICLFTALGDLFRKDRRTPIPLKSLEDAENQYNCAINEFDLLRE